MTSYVDFEKLESIDPIGFRATKPFPNANPHCLLTDNGFQKLIDNMPDIELFEKVFDYRRLGGQEPHNRYSLEYAADTPVPEPWKEFIAELCSDRYRRALQNLMGARKIRYRLHWHYTPNGCSVSPHVDSKREHGSQLFYFNAPGEWDPAWGGDTLVLDDGSKIHFESAPSLEDFVDETPARSIGNYSFMFERTDRAWHAVREIKCPDDRIRRVFILVAYPDSLRAKIRDRIVGKKAHFF